MTPYQVSSEIYGGFFYPGITLTPPKDSVYLKPDFIQSCRGLELQVVAGATILFSLLLIFLSLLLLCISHVKPIVPSFALIDFTLEFLLGRSLCY